MAAAYQWQGQDLHLSLYIQPRASRDAWVGVHGDSIKVRITAPPVDGKANKYLVAWLAKQFKVPKKQIQLLRGETGRHKQFLIQNPQKCPFTLLARTNGGF